MENINVDRTKIYYNGDDIIIERIFYNDTNYIKLRDLEKLGFLVGYDQQKNMPTLAYDYIN